MEFDAEPVTYAMMALTGVEQDDWSIEFDVEHMHFGQDGLGDFDWSNKADDAPISLALMATNSEAYKAAPPPTGTIIPPRANVSFTGIDELAIRNKVVNQEKTNTSQSAIDRNKVIIEDWVDSDDEETDVSESQKETVFNKENSEESFKNRSPNSQNSVGQESRTKGLGNKGGKLCFVCYSPNHLIKDCNLHERTFKHTQTQKSNGTQGSRETRTVWNNIQRVNHSNFTRNSRYPQQRRSFIPSAVLTRDGLISTARPKMTQTVPSKSTANVTYQDTARSRVPQAVLSRSTDGSYYPRMDNRRPRISSYSPSSRSSTTRTPDNHKDNKKVVKLIWVKKGSTVGSQAVLPQTVKKSAMISPKQTWKPKGNYLDSVNRGNGSYTLKQFEYGNPEEDLKDYAIITWMLWKYTGEQDKLSDFKEFHSCCGYKKHNVLFTDKECLILSPKFKFVDEDLVILRAPRKNDVYSLDLKNIIPSGGITCLVAKATEDEAVLWHRRLGHVNFKNINKLVKGNLVRGLPSKTFKLDHSCVACRKGKQHRASCKKIEERTDETYDMLHDLIVGLENRLRHKVKTIRCDHGTEFKNQLMNEFCAKKGIKREYSIARTPQQNGVAERKNRTLIEAARTMLADSLLPIQFWAEAVNTALFMCLIDDSTKPQLKTPYEILMGRSPNISFMRPFGCSLTILNTLDHLGKFDGKSEEGYLLGYSTNSKGFRVYNRITRKVQDCLHVNFLENQENQKGKGPDWMFDPWTLLTSIMNYIPVRKENYADSKEQGITCDDVEDMDDQQFIVHTTQSNASRGTIAFEEEKRRISIAKGKEHVDSTFNLSTANTPPQELAITPTDIWMMILQQWCFSSTNSFDARGKAYTAGVQTRRKLQDSTSNQHQALLSFIYKQNRTNHKDQQTCLFACFFPILQEEPKKVSQALADESWVEAMQEELLQFKLQEARLVAQGVQTRRSCGVMMKYIAPLHQYEAIRLFLAFASYMGFTVYQWMVQKCILCMAHHKKRIMKIVIAKEFKMSSMGELTFFLGLQVKQSNGGIFLSQDKYVKDILNKFDFRTIKPASTPIEAHKSLGKDEEGEDVDVHLYRSMIGCLMYLTASRQTMFAVCLCARFKSLQRFSSTRFKRIFRVSQTSPNWV
ncbi:ribonuclease H-like domain-containing protein [Tanacetum coccineum]